MIKYHRKPTKKKQSPKQLDAGLFSTIQSHCRHSNLYVLHSDREFVFYDVHTGKVLAQCHEADRNWHGAIRRAITRRNERSQ